MAAIADAPSVNSFDKAARFSAFVSSDRKGEASTHTLDLLVDGVHCGGCVSKIERALNADDAVENARLNLSTRRLRLAWAGDAAYADRLVETVTKLGFSVTPYNAEKLVDRDRKVERQLLIALTVAFFATLQVNALSWAVWSGHMAVMGEGTRAFFHWVSMVIALPAIGFAGQPFFKSAYRALKNGTANMDVPISLGVTLTTLMSLSETLRMGPHIYFDGAISLLFILLIGRYLDVRVRGNARSAVSDLAALTSQPVTIVDEEGGTVLKAPEDVVRDDIVQVTTGERFGVDGLVVQGYGQVDTSLIDGEADPKRMGVGDKIYAGTINLGPTLLVRCKASGQGTVIAEMVRLLEAAEQKRGRFVSFADMAMRWYTPLVHILAFGTFLAWFFLGSVTWQIALVYAVCVLIITCPCALGLAVPVSQVVAASRLMKDGIIVKSETAFERLAGIDTVVFDKTGTLTHRVPRAIGGVEDEEALAFASSMAAASRHPLSIALRQSFPDSPRMEGVSEVPGEGLMVLTPDGPSKLGSRAFVGLDGEGTGAQGTEVWLTRPNQEPMCFTFQFEQVSDAPQAIAALKQLGYSVEILSGDTEESVSKLAKAAGVEAYQSRVKPADKIKHVEALVDQGRKVLMVGDGLNDAPALSAATASGAPSLAVDISRNAADFVWQNDKLTSIVTMLCVAKKTQRVAGQNIAFSMAYNFVLVPIAMAGMVTPWIAAIAMGVSSIAVTLNAFRLKSSGAPRMNDGQVRREAVWTS